MLESFRRNGMSKGPNSFGLLPARAALGSTMLYHGIQKLRDAEKAGGSFEGMGISPGRPWALATALAETFAGASALLGVLTRPAALAVLVTQSVAIAKVHRKRGFDMIKGGYEFNLALMAIAAGLLLAGPGPLSVHQTIDSVLAERRASLLGRRRRRRRSKLFRILAALLR
jgi:putative oxidoreductase